MYKVAMTVRKGSIPRDLEIAAQIDILNSPET
jgi:hypothetical protein